MQALLALTLANIRSYTRDRAAVFWTLAFPLVFIVLFGLIFQGSSSARLTLGWVDDDRSAAAVQLKAGFAALDGVTLVDATQPKVNRALLLPWKISPNRTMNTSGKASVQKTAARSRV